MVQISFSPLTLNNFIEQQTKEPLYYSHTWHTIIAKLYGYQVILLTTSDNGGQITGLLPLCYVQSPITGRRLVSFSFADQCGPLAINDVYAHNLIEQAVELAQEKRVKALELRAGVNDVLAARSDFLVEHLYVRWYLPLVVNADDIWKNLRKPVQRQIVKAQKLGVRVRVVQQRDELMQYYRLHLATRTRKLGMPAQSLRFFYELWDHFAINNQLQVLFAEYEGSLVAGMILLTSGKCMRLGYTASNEKYLHLAPNNLLNWEAIKWGCAQGYEYYDLGRTARDNEGLMEYKRRWGALQEPLPYYYYPHVAGLASTAESSVKYRLLTSSWRRFPLPLAGFLSNLLYKHLG